MAIALREDFDASSMRAAAKRAKDAAQTRRLLALAAIYQGASRAKAADARNGFERLGRRARFPPSFDLLVDHGQVFVDGVKLIG